MIAGPCKQEIQMATFRLILPSFPLVWLHLETKCTVWALILESFQLQVPSPASQVRAVWPSSSMMRQTLLLGVSTTLSMATAMAWVFLSRLVLLLWGTPSTRPEDLYSTRSLRETCLRSLSLVKILPIPGDPRWRSLMLGTMCAHLSESIIFMQIIRNQAGWMTPISWRLELDNLHLKKSAPNSLSGLSPRHPSCSV